VGIEKYFSVGKRVATAVVLVGGLSSCEFLQAQMRLTVELGKMSYRMTTLPIRTLLQSDRKELENEPPVNRCIKTPEYETPEEKVCKIYLKKKIDSDPDVYEEYFGVLKIRKEKYQESELVKLIFGYFNGDNYDHDGRKNLIVVMYTGENREEFAIPTFGNLSFPYCLFETYFNNPRTEILDTRENPLKIAGEEELISLDQRTVFLKLLSEKIGYALKLADEQLPK